MTFPIYKDRVWETSTTTGTGAVTLDGARTGYQGFAVVGDGKLCTFVVEAIDGSGVPTGDWEVQLGVYTASGGTLGRTSGGVLASSNSGSLVSFGAGTKNVYLVVPAEKPQTDQAVVQALIWMG